MVRSIEGIFRNGQVELLEAAPIEAESRVIVTFLPAGNGADLATRGMGLEQAANLRRRLKTFEQDWLRPDMDAYDAL